MNRIIAKFKIDLDFVLIAVTSSLKDYRICYLINKHLQLNFSKTNDLALDIFQGLEPAYFSLYHYLKEDSETEFYFIANKGTEGLLIPEMREVDYFFMIKNQVDENEVELVITTLNRIPEIMAAVKIDPKKIKSRENLLF